MKEQLKNLIEVYNKQIRDITYSTSYKEPSKVQTVSVLRNVINDLKVLTNGAKACRNCKYFVENNQPTKDGYCNHDNIGTYDVDYDTEIRLDVNDDFCCNKWEQI